MLNTSKYPLTLRPGIDLSYFAFHKYFASVFAKYTTKYEALAVNLLYFIQISHFLNAVKK